MICDDFRQNVINILDKRGMSRSDLARAMNVTPQFITQLLKGVSDPGLGLVERVAVALEVEVATLVKKVKQSV